MDKEMQLNLLKANLGIHTEARDEYLRSILDTVSGELVNEKGIVVERNPDTYDMFLIDYTAWRYRNRGEGVMPRNLQYRLHNLLVHSLRKGGQINGD